MDLLSFKKGRRNESSILSKFVYYFSTNPTPENRNNATHEQPSSNHATKQTKKEYYASDDFETDIIKENPNFETHNNRTERESLLKNPSFLAKEKEKFPLIFRSEKSDNYRKETVNLDQKPKKNKIDRVEKTEKIVKKFFGLQNQGATCYLNSILQTLFHLPFFRQFIFEIPFNFSVQNSDNDKSKKIFEFKNQSRHQNVPIKDHKNVILNLQILFAQLQTSQTAVTTRNLTQSFGWSKEQTLIQQDIAEFCNQLLNCIKNKLKNTTFSKTIDDLFTSVTRTFYRGVYTNFEESSDDNFFVLSVVVKGFSTLSESLHSLTSTQFLTGKNQYESKEFGKQDANLTTKFVKFPKVLMIHLKRFEFDKEKNRNIKINSILMFEENLNISDFLLEKNSANSKSETEYELHAVLVHSGNVDGGHYFAYIRPNLDRQWYKFNDSSVSLVDKTEAIDNNFGGPDLNEDSDSNSAESFFGSEERSFSAYMLVYVRKDSLGEIFCDVDDSIISEKVKMKILNEGENEGQIQINIVDEKCLAMNAFKGRLSFQSSMKHLKPVFVSNSLSNEDFYRSISEQLEISENLFTLYTFDDDRLTGEIRKSGDNTIIRLLQNESCLFLSMSQEHSHRHVIFIYLYIKALKHPLRYLTNLAIKSKWPISKTLKNQIKSELNLSKPYKSSVFVKNGPVLNLIEGENTLFGEFINSMYIVQISESSEIDDIIFEKGFLNDDEKNYSTHSVNNFDFISEMPSNASDYFDVISDRTTTEIKTVEKFDSPIRIKYSNILTVSQFFQFVSKIVQAKEDQEIYIYKAYEVLPIEHNEEVNKMRVYQISLYSKYLIVNVSDSIENNLALLEIIYSNDAINQNNRSPILVRKDMTVAEVLYELKNSTNNTNSNSQTVLRLLQMNEDNNSVIKGIVRVLKNDEIVSKLRNPLRIEPVPFDQIDIQTENLIPVLFYNRNNKLTLNFLLTVIEDEIFSETKKRIQIILNKDDNCMEQMSFYFLFENQKQTLKDYNIIAQIFAQNCQIRITQFIPENHEIKIYN